MQSPTQSNVIFEEARRALKAPLLEKFLLPEEIGRRWSQSAGKGVVADRFARFLEDLDVTFDCATDELARIPRSGAVVVVANHPFGLVEGAILGALLQRVRPDVKILANSLLASIQGLEDCIVPVDPFGGAAKSNWRGLRQSIAWLAQGGLLVTFPAGEVAALRLQRMQILEPEWNERIARVIRLTHACSVPVFFHGVNSAAFQIAGVIHPRLRTVLLPRELLNKKGATIRVAIGRPVSAQSLARHGSDEEAIGYLHRRTLLLQARTPSKPAHKPFPFRIGPIQARIAGGVSPQAMRQEAETLSSGNVLLESGPYTVCEARAAEIPNTLREIGRLREIAFRKVGEGTGRSLDLDRFDQHYRHLWVWNRERDEVCGAYRLGGTDTTSDLYTSTLFHFRPGLLEQLHPALELGRSFVRPEYQKSYQALLLLWKGIGRYVARHPRYRVLFGPVSISKDYSRASRSLMVSYLESSCDRPELADSVEPRRQFRTRRFGTWDAGLLGPHLRGLDELSEVVADIEADGKGVPVLLRQYLQLGGTVLAFNVDRAFSDVVDGLMVVDLARMAPAVLEKYLGKEGAIGFREHHGAKKQSL
jgi:putative hemolysin